MPILDMVKGIATKMSTQHFKVRTTILRLTDLKILCFVLYDKELEHTHVYDPIWVNPFWYVKNFKQAHLQPSRTHAVNILQLQQRTLLPPVNLKVIKNQGRSDKKRHLSKGEEGNRLLAKKVSKVYSVLHRNNSKTTTDIVLASRTFHQIQVASL
jgi:hypothetical protein